MTRSEEWAHKLSEVRRWLARTGAGAVLVEEQGAFAWLTCGGDSHVSLGQQEGCASVLVTRDRVFLLAANNEVDRVLAEELSSLPLEAVTFPWYQPTQSGSLVARLARSGPVLSDLGQLGFARTLPSRRSDSRSSHPRSSATAESDGTRRRRWRPRVRRPAPVSASVR